MIGLKGISFMYCIGGRNYKLAHPAMHRSIQSLGCSWEHFCDRQGIEEDPKAALVVLAAHPRLLKDYRVPFAREPAGRPSCPVFYSVVVFRKLRTTTPASYVFRSPLVFSEACRDVSARGDELWYEP